MLYFTLVTGDSSKKLCRFDQGGNCMFQALGEGAQPLGPDEFLMLQRIVADHCREQGVAIDSHEGREASRELLRLFQLGMTENGKLRNALRSPV